MGCKATIGELCSRVCSGGTPRRNIAEFYDGGTIPWLNTSEISFNRIRKTEQHITEAGLNDSSAKWIRENSVIVAMYGATAGKAAIAKIPLTTNQACCNLEINEEVADYRYIYYWFKNQYSHVLGLANGGAQQNLSAKTIRALEVELPSLMRQQQTANLLSSIDDKIEFNGRLNGYLAEMLDIQYQYALERSCETKKLVEVSEILSGGTPSTRIDEYWQNGSIPFFAPGDVTNSIYTMITEKHITESGLANCNSALYPTDTVFLTARGTVGKVAMAGVPMAMNQSCFAFAGIGIPQTVVFQIIKRAVYSLKTKAIGAVFAAINTRDLKLEEVDIPNSSVMADYDAFARPIHALIKANEEEALRLAELRGALLPKLMSGEIDVSEVDLTQLNSHLA